MACLSELAKSATTMEKVARSLLGSEPEETSPARAVWASEIDTASPASVGIKRSISEKIMAISLPGRPIFESGAQAASKALPRSV